MPSDDVNTPKHSDALINGAHASSSPVVPIQLAKTPSPVGRPHYRRKGFSWFLVLFIVAIVAVVGISIFVNIFPWPYDITLNGHTVSVTKYTTTDELFEISGFKPKPGNLLAIDGNVIEEGGGEAYSIFVDDEKVDIDSYLLSKGDSVVLANGDDTYEEITEEIIDLPNALVSEGMGSIHALRLPEEPGQMVRRTGVLSGVVVEEQLSEPATVLLERFNVDTNGEKVIALTFDDGPWQGTTNQILDILEENGAKATFFTIGSQIEGNEDAILRAHNDGMQICTHTWDHASGDGMRVNLDFMSEQDQIDEIVMGLQAISNVTGEEASKVIRVPGGNFSDNTARIASNYATYEIGWNIDTNDWRKPGVAAIEEAILSAKPGDVVLMHDGGGDRSQTIEALALALPVLKEQGYQFVTIDELLKYA